jgi:hypothetical protein
MKYAIPLAFVRAWLGWAVVVHFGWLPLWLVGCLVGPLIDWVIGESAIPHADPSLRPNEGAVGREGARH